MTVISIWLVCQYASPILALHFTLILPALLCPSLTFRLILLRSNNEVCYIAALDYLPVGRLQQSITFSEDLCLSKWVILDSISIEKELQICCWVWSMIKLIIWNLSLIRSNHLSDQHSTTTSLPTDTTSLLLDILGPLPSGWTKTKYYKFSRLRLKT